MGGLILWGLVLNQQLIEFNDHLKIMSRQILTKADQGRSSPFNENQTKTR